mgnify:CR=1 FL=1
MDKLRIAGGRALRGRVPVAGAKNAALPALAATLLTGESVTLTNLPRVRDVRTMLRVLEQLGAEVEESAHGTATVKVARLQSFEAPYDLVKTMRASVLGKGRPMLPGRRSPRIGVQCVRGEVSVRP